MTMRYTHVYDDEVAAAMQSLRSFSFGLSWGTVLRDAEDSNNRGGRVEMA